MGNFFTTKHFKSYGLISFCFSHYICDILAYKSLFQVLFQHFMQLWAYRDYWPDMNCQFTLWMQTDCESKFAHCCRCGSKIRIYGWARTEKSKIHCLRTSF